MATNNRPLKAYVRYDGSGRAVSSSLIWRKNKPKVGNWKEVQGYECCNPEFTTNIEFQTIPGGINPGVGFSVKCGEDAEGTLIYFISYPPEINTTVEIVSYLNTLLSGVASFTVVNGITISVSFSQTIANAICQGESLTVVPYYAA
jgi:hypothetical protein